MLHSSWTTRHHGAWPLQSCGAAATADPSYGYRRGRGYEAGKHYTAERRAPASWSMTWVSRVAYLTDAWRRKQRTNERHLPQKAQDDGEKVAA